MPPQEKIVMYDAPEAARKVVMMLDGKELSHGYLSIDNFFYNDESMARYRSCTHKKCECGEIMSKNRTICKKCSDRKIADKYLIMPFKEWDGNCMVCLYDDDKFFRDDADFLEWCEEEEQTPDNIRLVICEENRLTTIDSDIWSDIMPEDGDGELPKEVQLALDKLNEAIKAAPPVSYSAGKFRTHYISLTENTQ